MGKFLSICYNSRGEGRRGVEVRGHGFKFIELLKSPSKYRTNVVVRSILHRKVNRCNFEAWNARLSKSNTPFRDPCICFPIGNRISILHFRRLMDSNANEFIILLFGVCVSECVCVLYIYSIIFIIIIMLCENQIKCVVILKFSTWQQLTHHARMRPFEFLLILVSVCVCVRVVLLYWMGYGRHSVVTVAKGTKTFGGKNYTHNLWFAMRNQL